MQLSEGCVVVLTPGDGGSETLESWGGGVTLAQNRYPQPYGHAEWK